jgi:hypothetical protein
MGIWNVVFTMGMRSENLFEIAVKILKNTFSTAFREKLRNDFFFLKSSISQPNLNRVYDSNYIAYQIYYEF